eukprot:363930-Chlamydomonas_euryale.AAC.4
MAPCMGACCHGALHEPCAMGFCMCSLSAISTHDACEEAIAGCLPKLTCQVFPSCTISTEVIPGTPIRLPPRTFPLARAPKRVLQKVSLGS